LALKSAAKHFAAAAAIALKPLVTKAKPMLRLYFFATT